MEWRLRPALALFCKETGLPALPRPHLHMSPSRAFLTAALAQGLCEVLLVVTKEVEETGCWLHTS